MMMRRGKIELLLTLTKKILVTLLFFCLLLTAPLGSANPESGGPDPFVEKVLVRIDTLDPPSSRVVKRMSESVKMIGEHILLGHKVVEVSSRRETYEKLIRDVFDRVLIGYSVEKVEIEPGVDSRIDISLTPWGDTVREVSVQVDYSGIAADAVPLVQADMGRLTEDIKGALIGLPVDSVEWASGVARDLIRELLKQKLPEFHFSLDVEAGKQTAVRLSLFPVGQLVKNATISLRSETIPNMLLIHARPAVEMQARSMRGLPVSYVWRHLPYFQKKLGQAAMQDLVIKQFDLKVSPTIRPGEDTEAIVTVEAETWRITAEAYLDVGRSHDNVSGKAHVGRTIGRHDEVFMELKLLPGTMSWEFMPGWGHQLGSDSWAGFRYRTNDKEWMAFLNQGLGGRWSLRVERWPHLEWTEVGMRYKLHDYLSLEFVINNDSNWLRLVGHL